MADVMVDSNIWIYYFDRTTQEHDQVVEFMDGLLETGNITINVIILMEIAHYLIKNLGSVIGREKLDILLSSGIDIVDMTLKDSRISIDFLSKYTHTGIGGRDASILSSMQSSGKTKLVTHDKSFLKIDEIEVIDPIK